MFKVFTGGRTLLDPVLVPIERLVLRLTGVNPDGTAGLEAVLGLPPGLEHRHVAGDVRHRVAAAPAAAQSRRHRQHGADAVVQHDLELRDQHEPAALQRRDGAVVLLADVRHQLPAVRDRGHRHGGLHRRHPWPCRQPSDALGNFYVDLTRATVRVFLPLAIARVGHPDVAGHADDLRGRGTGDDGRGRKSRRSLVA